MASRSYVTELKVNISEKAFSSAQRIRVSYSAAKFLIILAEKCSNKRKMQNEKI